MSLDLATAVRRYRRRAATLRAALASGTATETRLGALRAGLNELEYVAHFRFGATAVAAALNWERVILEGLAAPNPPAFLTEDLRRVRALIRECLAPAYDVYDTDANYHADIERRNRLAVLKRWRYAEVLVDGVFDGLSDVERTTLVNVRKLTEGDSVPTRFSAVALESLAEKGLITVERGKGAIRKANARTTIKGRTLVAHAVRLR